MGQVLDHFRPVWRRGGRRAEPERIWRNCTLDGRRLDYSNAWKPPYQGVLEIDFVRALVSCALCYWDRSCGSS